MIQTYVYLHACEHTEKKTYVYAHTYMYTHTQAQDYIHAMRCMSTD